MDSTTPQEARRDRARILSFSLGLQRREQRADPARDEVLRVDAAPGAPLAEREHASLNDTNHHHEVHQIDRLLAITNLDTEAPAMGAMSDGDDRQLSHQGAAISHLRAVRLGVSSGAFYPTIATEDVPVAAARLGVSDVELMLQTAGEYDPAFIRSIAGQYAALGTNVHSVHTMLALHPMLDRYSRRAAEGRAMFDRAIEAAATLGASVLVWHGPKREDVTTPAGWERFVALTAELAAACGAVGVTLGLENVSWCALATVRDVVSFATRLTEIGTASQVGFVFDPFQAVEAGANPFMILAAMGNRVVNIHISDYRAEDVRSRHLPPGDGDLPWSALLRAVAGSGYTGPMMIEGPLGDDGTTFARVREKLNPLIRSVFSFAPDGIAGTDAVLDEPPAGVRTGIDLFNEGRFYEAHEAIEHEWHAERGPIRRLYQGILQIGVGFHHALNGNHRGAILLLTDGIDKTAAFTPRCLGLETGALVSQARDCLARLTALGPDRLAEFDTGLIPRIEG